MSKENKMGSVRETFTFPRKVSNKLRENVKNNRSDFVAKAVIEALEKRDRENLIDLIENTPLEDAVEDSVETVRKIRQEETDKLINNS